jgi:tRNA-specific 2-thiouridylase
MVAGNRVTVAMSGGVDSSVAAALLVERGYDVVGLMLHLWPVAGGDHSHHATDTRRDAQHVAQILGIPFHWVDMSQEFERWVVDYFVSEYAAGRTPNPCVECNRRVRFDLMLRQPVVVQSRYLATGHYARIEQADGRYLLCRGIDARKDQSYFLYTLNQSQLAQVLFPVGEFTKFRVREMARERGLPVAARDESQDLCFVRDGDYRRFLSARAPEMVRPGPICDRAGRVLGEHRGLAMYTIGQRKGLGISAPEPLYVLAMDPANNVLVVGTADELGADTCLARRLAWISGTPPGQVFRATAKIRYRAGDVPVTVNVVEDGGAVRVRFAQSLRDITPGQSIVFYRGEYVLGGGTIAPMGEW